jgi:hypothetical protein
MFDGLKLLCLNQDPARWLNAPELVGVGFSVLSDGQTGEVKEQKAEFNGLTFSVLPSVSGGSVCLLKGSLHKFWNGKGSNADRFTLADFQAVVLNLQQRFGLDPQKAVVQNLEIGVNLSLPYSPQRAIKSAVTCRHRPFVHTQESDSRLSIGKVAVFDEYKVKLYDKGRQERNAAAKLLRIEVKYNKTRPLRRYEIRTLADLTNPDKVAPLLAVLLDTISAIVFLDTAADFDRLSDREHADYRRFRDLHTWESEHLNRWQRQDRRQRITLLSKKCNAYPFAQDLLSRVADEWQTVTNGAANVPAAAAESVGSEAHGKATFSPLDCLGEIVADDLPTTAPNRAVDTGIDKSLSPAEQCCISCGKRLISPKSFSRFCSEKYNGKTAARHCRNRDSNPRRTKRNRIMKAQAQDKFLRIVYTDPNGNEYADILHASEVGVSRADLDKIVSVTILADCPNAADGSGPNCCGRCSCANQETLIFGPARDLLTDLTTQNAPAVQESTHPPA